MTEAEKRQQVHALVEQLPSEQLSIVALLLRKMADPVARALEAAPLDDEPLTPGEEKALEEAEEWLRTHDPIPNEEVLADFGLTVDDIKGTRNRQ